MVGLLVFLFGLDFFCFVLFNLSSQFTDKQIRYINFACSFKTTNSGLKSITDS